MIATERPALWMVAGPNGSGKSSLYGNTDIEVIGQSVWIINPDLLTGRIQQVEKLSQSEANVEAVVRIEAWLEASIRAHQTVGARCRWSGLSEQPWRGDRAPWSAAAAGSG